MDAERMQNKWLFKVLIGTMLLFLIIINFQSKEYGQQIKNISKVNFRGSYEINGEIRLIEDYKIPNTKNSRKVILRGRFNKYIPPGKEMFFYMHRMRMTIKQNGKEIYSYGHPGSYPDRVESVGTDWARFTAQGINREDKIEIILESAYGDIYEGIYTNFLNNIYAGDRFAFLRQQMKKNLFSFIVSIITFISGIILLVAGKALKYIEEPVPDGYVSCALLIISGGLCTFINYGYITLIFNNAFMVNIIDFLLQLFLCGFFMAYLRNYISSKRNLYISECFIRFSICVMIGYFLLQLMGIVDTFRFLKVLLPTGALFSFIMLFFILMDYRKYADWKTKRVLISSLILWIVAIVEVVHYLFVNTYWILLFQVGLLVFTVTQFSIILSYTKQSIDKFRKTQLLEKELAQNRIAIMLSQIQPHFLYNALTSIQELCLCDPNRAYTVLGKFSQFLRGNMDSLNSSELIPFEKELQHVKNYLYLEKMRYGDYLKIEYEIEISDFFLPALALQPIVENAVRYGIGKKEEGGKVTIRTNDTEEYYRIIVQDDGVGFSVEDKSRGVDEDSTRSHIGLENVKNRLKAQCNGVVRIESQINIGTMVTILIPKRRG